MSTCPLHHVYLLFITIIVFSFNAEMSIAAGETPTATETPTAIPTPTPTPTILRSRLILFQRILDLDGHRVGAVHPLTGQLYVGDMFGFSIFSPNQGKLIFQEKRGIPFNVLDGVSVSEDDTLFCYSFSWDDFMVFPKSGKHSEVVFADNNSWRINRIHAVSSTDNIPGLGSGDVLILHNEDSSTSWRMGRESFWVVNYRSKTVDLNPYLPADQLPPNIKDWTIGPDGKLHWLTLNPNQVYRLEENGEVRQLNHTHLPVPGVAHRFEYLSSENAFYILAHQSQETYLYRISDDFKELIQVFSTPSRYYSSYSDVLASKDGKYLYLLIASENQIVVLKYQDDEPLPTPTPQPTAAVAGWYVLDGFGGIHTSHPDIPRPALPYFDFDIVRDLEPDPLGRGWYMLDGYGTIYRSSDELPLPDNSPYFGFDLARNLEIKLKEDKLVFYLLDSWGAVHTDDPDFEQKQLPYFLFQPVLCDLEPDPGGDGWLTLDIYGQIYSTYGPAPALWEDPPAFDIPLGRKWDDLPVIRGMVRFPDESTVLIDAFGGRHTSPYYPAKNIVDGLPDDFYFPNWEIIWDVEIAPENQIPSDLDTITPVPTPTPTPTPFPEPTLPLLRELHVESDVVSIQYSPDNLHILIALKNGEIRIYDPNLATIEYQLNSPVDNLHVAVFSPNGESILAGYGDSSIVSWDAQSKIQNNVWKVDYPVSSLAVLDNPSVILAGTKSNRAYLLNRIKGTTLKTYYSNLGEEVLSVAASNDGLYLYTGTESQVYQWSRIDNKLEMTDLPGAFLSLNPTGRQHWSGGNILVQYDQVQKKELHRHNVEISCLSVSQKENRIAAGNENGGMTLWRLDDAPPLRWRAHNGITKNVAFNKSGTQCMSAGEDRVVRIWDLISLSEAPVPTRTPTIPPSSKTLFHKKPVVNVGGLRGEVLAVHPTNGNIYYTASGAIYCAPQPGDLFEDVNAVRIANLPSAYSFTLDRLAVASDGTMYCIDRNVEEFMLVLSPDGQQTTKINLFNNHENDKYIEIESILIVSDNQKLPGANVGDILIITHQSHPEIVNRIWRIDPKHENPKPEKLIKTTGFPRRIADGCFGPDGRLYVCSYNPARIYMVGEDKSLIEYTHFMIEGWPYQMEYLDSDRAFYILMYGSILRIPYFGEQQVDTILSHHWSDIGEGLGVSPDGQWLYYLLDGHNLLMGLKTKNPLPPYSPPVESPTDIPTATPIPGWLVLDGYGGIHTTKPEKPKPVLPYFYNYNIVRDLEPDPLGRGWYMLDGLGGIHASSPDLPRLEGLPYFSYDIVRNLELRYDSGNLFYYVLDGFGNIYTNDPHFDRGHLPFFDSDKARDLEPEPGQQHWLMLDHEGQVFFSRMPVKDWPLNYTMSWNPLANSLVRFENHQSIILDGYGGRLTNPYFPAPDKIDGLHPNFYFPDWDIIKDVEMLME